MEHSQIYANWATVFTLFVGIIAFLWQSRLNIFERGYQKSQFALQSALDAYEQAYNLLKNRNNDRVTWVSAARILEHGNRISKKVSEETHRDILEIQRIRYRHVLGELLGSDDHPISASFFYGQKDDTSDLDTAAMESTRREDVPHSPETGWKKPVMKSIPESALFIIWKFAQYPENYEDVVEGRFPEDILNSHPDTFFRPALFEYLRHQRKWVSINGKLVKLGDK